MILLPEIPEGVLTNFQYGGGGSCHYFLADPEILSLMFWGPQILGPNILETPNIVIYFWDSYNVFNDLGWSLLIFLNF